MAVSSPRAIPVRSRQTTLRNMVLNVDPEFTTLSQEVPEYEFTRRIFKGRYADRGPYDGVVTAPEPPDPGDTTYEEWLASQYVEPGYVETGYIENDQFTG